MKGAKTFYLVLKDVTSEELRNISEQIACSVFEVAVKQMEFNTPYKITILDEWFNEDEKSDHRKMAITIEEIERGE